uniref:AcrA-like protein n=1 Tax=Acidiphilium symbioticum TaxID=94005 RepID=A6YQV3_9PROT|nr:AcrA-like protein [Acidiphilium symbioticum]
MIRYRLEGFIALFIPFSWSIHACAAPLHLDAHDIAAAGIKTTVLIESLHAREIAAQGTMLDPAAIMQTQSRLVTANADVATARAEMIFASEQAAQNRKVFYGGEKIFAIRIAAINRNGRFGNRGTDRRASKTSSRKTTAITQWGPVMTSAMQITRPSRTVIGVSLPPSSALSQLPTIATANHAGETYDLALIGAIPGMLGGIPGEALLYSMPTQRNLPIGTYLNVGVPTGSEINGVTVPASAVIWEHGRAIAYRADAAGNFEPVDISTATPVQGGYFISGTLTPGDHIVSQGAELLAAAPTAPKIVKAKSGNADPDDD